MAPIFIRLSPVSSPALSDPGSSFFFFFFPYKNVCLLQKRERERSPREIISLVYKVKNLEASYILPNGNRFNRNKDLCYFLVSALCRLEKIL